MTGTITARDETAVQGGADAVAERLEGGEFFWLDLDGVDAEAAALLADRFEFHPLTVEDAEHFNQRPKIEDSLLRCLRDRAVRLGSARGPPLL